MKVPIYRAKNKYVEGYTTGHLVKDSMSDRCFIINWFMPDTIDQDNGYIEVGKSTLEVSLDGENWKSMKDLEEMFIFDNEMMKINIDAGGRVK